jgi:hypothetical protein
MARHQVLTVTNLAAGASVVVAHAMSVGGVAMIPTTIAPMTPTPIGVASATTSQITFTNYGNQIESAVFHVEREVANQQPDTVASHWGGFAGYKTFILTSPQFDDLRIGATSVRIVGAGVEDPTFAVFRAPTRTWMFAAAPVNEEQLFFETQLPHGYVEGTDLTPHVHWATMDANAGNVIWQMHYTITAIGNVYPPATPLETPPTATPGVAYKETLTDFPVISGAGLSISSVLHVCFRRKTSDPLDTYAGVCAFSSFDFHLQVNSLGSRLITTK